MVVCSLRRIWNETPLYELLLHRFNQMRNGITSGSWIIFTLWYFKHSICAFHIFPLDSRTHRDQTGQAIQSGRDIWWEPKNTNPPENGINSGKGLRAWHHKKKKMRVDVWSTGTRMEKWHWWMKSVSLYVLQGPSWEIGLLTGRAVLPALCSWDMEELFISTSFISYKPSNSLFHIHHTSI